MKSLNLNRLFYFHTFVRKKNVAMAAEELSISQPALSSQLKLLESELNTALFNRSTRHLELTDKGEHLYHYTRQIFETCQEMVSELNSSADTTKLSLRIGVTDQIERPFSVRFISALFHDKNPIDAKRFNVTSSTHEYLIKLLRSGELDLILSKEPAEDKTIQTLAKIEMPVVLALPKSYKGNKSPAIEDCLADIENQKINLVAQSPILKLRQKMNTFLFEKNIKPKIILESDILAILFQTVIDGIGAGFFSLPYLSEELKNGKIKIAGLPNGYWKETMYLMANQKSQMVYLYPEIKRIFENSFLKSTIDFT